MDSQLTAGRLGLVHKELPEGTKLMAAYLASPLPAPPTNVTWPTSLQSCGMLGNGPDPSAPDYPQGVGDCTIAGTVHLRMLDAALTAEQETWPTGEQTIAAYMELSGGRDSGLVESDVLKAWQSQGILGNKIAAFAPLDISDTAELQSACALFGGTKVDVNVPANAMSQFDARQPWHLDGSAADNQSLGGHSIVRCGFYVDTKLGLVWALLTWGTVQLATDAWMQKNTLQDWAVITNEFVTANPGLIDLAALKADIARL